MFIPSIHREECTICLDSLYTDNPISSKRFYSTPCNHHFHFRCLKRWCLANNNCPTCRRDNIMNLSNYNYENYDNNLHTHTVPSIRHASLRPTPPPPGENPLYVVPIEQDNHDYHYSNTYVISQPTYHHQANYTNTERPSYHDEPDYTNAENILYFSDRLRLSLGIVEPRHYLDEYPLDIQRLANLPGARREIATRRISRSIINNTRTLTRIINDIQSL